MATGSFEPEGSIQGMQVRAEREREERNVAEAEAEEKRQQKEIDAAVAKENEEILPKLLPKHIICAYGIVSYSLFKEKYKSIFDGVKERDYLRGYCSYSGKVAGIPISVRTLRTRETRTLQSMCPDITEVASLDLVSGTMFRIYRILLSMTEFDGNAFNPTGDINPEVFPGWLKSVEGKQRMEFLDSLPIELILQIDTITADIGNAYMYAVKEAMQDPE